MLMTNARPHLSPHNEVNMTWVQDEINGVREGLLLRQGRIGKK
jgi:hypothetical protein